MASSTVVEAVNRKQVAAASQAVATAMNHKAGTKVSHRDGLAAAIFTASKCGAVAAVHLVDFRALCQGETPKPEWGRVSLVRTKCNIDRFA